MDNTQSFLVLGPNSQIRAAAVTLLASGFGINLDKISPDIFIISPQKQTISIDEIRDLKKHIFQKPVKEKFKFILIKDAQKLTLEAQNALLKIIEEPPQGAIIVLEARDKAELLPTIVSRVVIKNPRFQKPDLSNQSVLLKPQDLSTLLEVLGTISSPGDWLDHEIIALHEALQKRIKGKNPAPLEDLLMTIVKCKETKELIAANVNPKFALAGLAFAVHSKPEN